jgi:hypothetical protein
MSLTYKPSSNPLQMSAGVFLRLLIPDQKSKGGYAPPLQRRELVEPGGHGGKL